MLSDSVLSVLVSSFILLVSLCNAQTAPITDSFNKEDTERVAALAMNTLSNPTQHDLATLFYASSIVKGLGQQVKSSKPVCDFVKSKVAASASQLQNAYYIAGISKALSCAVPAKDFEKTIKTVEDEKTKMQDRFYGIQAAADFGSLASINADLLVKSISAQLTSNVDTPLSNQVYGVHIASNLAGTAKTSATELNNLFLLVEDIIGQADEVNEKYLQLEGGLGVTALFVEGAFNLAAKLNKPPLILQNKLQQLSSYILSRKDSQNLKSLYFVVLSAHTLSTNQHFIPVAVSLDTLAFSAASKDEKVKVRVTNLLGAELKGVSGVTAEQVERNSDSVIVVSKEQLKATTPSDKSVYTLDLLKLKPGAGFYTLTVSVSSSSTPGSAKLVGMAPGNAKLSLRVLTEVTASNMNIAVIDSESTSTIGKQNPVSYPNALKSTLYADSTQKVVASFSIKDKLSNLDFEPHQVFMRMVHIESDQEVFFVCEKSAGQYEFEMKLKASDSIFKSLSGDYNMYLIVGDAVASNSFMWQLAKITLAFAEGKTYQPASYLDEFKPKPEIHHMFRQPDPRPALIFSQAFAVLALLPLLFLLLIWSKMGANVANMEMDVPTIGFHLGLASIFGLYYCYWAHLNMFQTMKWLVLLGSITFFCGHKLLKKLAIARVNNSRVVGG